MVKNLKLLRTKKGVSQQYLANQIGVSQQSINKYENHNVEPDIATLMAMAAFFHTSVDYLIGYTDFDHVIESLQAADLNEEETELVEGFRKLSFSEKSSILSIISNYNNYKK